MASMKFELVVEYDDGTTVDVVAGQRECAEWERQPFGCSTKNAAEVSPMLFFMFIAWAALRRRGDRRSFDVWSECVAGALPPDDDEEDGEAAPVDPTTPAPSSTD